MMHPTNCLNCNQTLQEHQKFCDQCGQKVDTHRLTVGHIFHDFFHAVTHTDKSIINLLKGLATHPGKVAAEYVEGKRKKYFAPSTFLLLCLSVMVFVNNVVKPFPELKPDPKIVAQLPTKKIRDNYISSINRTNNATKLVSKNTNLVYMMAIPFYAFVVWLFYRRRGRNFAEITLAFVLFTAFSALVFTLIFTPLMAYYRGSSISTYSLVIGTVMFILYYIFALKRFFNYQRPVAYIHLFFVVLLFILLWSIITVFIMYYYIYGNKVFDIIGFLWKKL